MGQPLPGTSIQVVDPVTLQPVPDGQQGLLLAQGPGVMAGYWQDPAATSKALFDGWFDTGGCRGWGLCCILAAICASLASNHGFRSMVAAPTTRPA